MVEEKKERLIIEKKIKELINIFKVKKVKKEMENNKQSVVLFFSFDITNSSKYKTVNYLYWPIIINQLFKFIEREISNQIEKYQLWRILGDEIVFIKQISDLKELWNDIKIINDIKNLIVKSLKEGSFFEKELITIDNENLKKSMHLNNILSLKSAAWIGLVTDQTEKDNYLSHPYGNIEIIYKSRNIEDRYPIYEFLGNDIDAGFRLSKAVISQNLVISFELAYFLYKYMKNNNKQELEKDTIKENNNLMHIITYKKFKGIWDEKLYPVIWYYKGETKELEESFDYNDYLNSEIVKEFIDNREKLEKSKIINGIKKEMFIINNYFFEKIIEDNNLIKKITEIENNIVDIQKKELINISTKLELHCAVLCYKNEKEPEILIAKRSKNRKYEPEKWELGCAKADTKNKLIDKIRDEYEKDFNIKIELEIESDREDNQPKPLLMYTVNKNGDYHQGIIFIAKIKNDEKLRPNKLKFSEVKFIKENDINLINGDTVKDFRNSLQKGFDYIKKKGKVYSE